LQLSLYLYRMGSSLDACDYAVCLISKNYTLLTYRLEITHRWCLSAEIFACS